jgi:hypothetical protein
VKLIVWRILRDAAWAPAAVLIFHQVAIRLHIRSRLDHLIHFLGGAAAAYFFYRAVKIAAPYLGKLQKLTRYLLAFTLTCTIAVFWELAEFASDKLRGTHIQQSISETLWDLISGVTGATVCLALIFIFWLVRGRGKLT